MSTPEEQKPWRYLRAKRFCGFKFRRQHQIGPYLADFGCLERHLIIELDGGQHAEHREEKCDEATTSYLRSRVIE